MRKVVATDIATVFLIRYLNGKKETETKADTEETV